MLLNVYTEQHDQVEVLYSHEEHHFLGTEFSYVFCELLFVPWSNTEEIEVLLHSPIPHELSGAVKAFSRERSYAHLLSHLMQRYNNDEERIEQNLHLYQFSFRESELPINVYTCGPMRKINEDEYRYRWWGVEVEAPEDREIEVRMPSGTQYRSSNYRGAAIGLWRERGWEAGKAYALRFGLFARHPMASINPAVSKIFGADRYAMHLFSPHGFEGTYTQIPPTRFWLRCGDNGIWMAPVLENIRECIAQNLGPSGLDLSLLSNFNRPHSSVWVIMPSRLNIRHLWFVDYLGRFESNEDRFRFVGQATWMLIGRLPPVSSLTVYEWQDDEGSEERVTVAAGDSKGVTLRFYLQPKRRNFLRTVVYGCAAGGVGAMGGVTANAWSWPEGVSHLFIAVAVWLIAFLGLLVFDQLEASTWTKDHPGG